MRRHFIDDIGWGTKRESTEILTILLTIVFYIWSNGVGISVDSQIMPVIAIWQDFRMPVKDSRALE